MRGIRNIDKYSFQNIITKRELEDENYSLLTEVFRNNEDDPDSKKIKLDHTADYKKLISLLLGSLYVSFQSQTFSNSDHIKKTSKRLTGGASQVDTAEFPDQPVQFTELKSKPLGDIMRKESFQLLNYVESNDNLLFIFILY